MIYLILLFYVTLQQQYVPADRTATVPPMGWVSLLFCFNYKHATYIGKKNREDILKVKGNLKPKTKQINLLKIWILYIKKNLRVEKN